MKVILSHPFSGSIHWWFGQLRGVIGDQALKHPNSGYYRSLYGDIDTYFDIALASLVIFDDVVLPAADAAFPGEGGRIPELNIVTDWEPTRHAIELYDSHEEQLNADPGIGTILRRVPRNAWWMALQNAIADIVLSRENDAPVICSRGRKALIDRLVALEIVPRLQQDIALARASRTMASDLEDYVTVAGLLFRAENLDSLASIKWSERVREYAGEFQRVLVSTASQPELGGLYEHIATAWTAVESGESIASAFSAASRSFSVVSLIPGAGTVTGALGIAADAASAAVGRRNERLRWFQLGPEISRYQSLRDLQARLHERRLL